MEYRKPELTVVGDARGIVLGQNLVETTIDTEFGQPYSDLQPYTTRF